MIKMDQGISPKGNMINTALRYTFDEGLDKQGRLNNDWLREEMCGHWKCRNCGYKTPFGYAPERCEDCGCKWPDYVEVRFQHQHSRVIGSVDAFVNVGTPLLKLVECKIIKSDDFKKLQGPMAEHRERTNLYLRLVAESNAPDEIKNRIDLTEAHVFYMMRGHGMKDESGQISPFKEYVIKRDDSKSEHYLAKANALTFSKEMNFQATEDETKYYPGGICSDVMCPRASKCPVAKACFSGKYPSNVTWVNNKGEPHHDDAEFLTTATNTTTIGSPS